MKKVYVIRAIGIALTVFMMIFIFSMSSQNATISNSTSGGVIRFTLSFAYPGFNGLDEVTQNNIIGSLQGVVRNMGHFSGFAALAFSSLIFTLTLEKFKIISRYASSIIFSFLYAVSDEIHQFFVPGRAFQFFDIFVDFCGILTGALFMYLITLILKKWASK